jgi:hypothetical protein
MDHPRRAPGDPSALVRSLAKCAVDAIGTPSCALVRAQSVAVIAPANSESAVQVSPSAHRMCPLPLFLFACCLALLAVMVTPDAHATETDQFTLPPQALDDLGPDLGAMVLAILRAEIDQLNARIDAKLQVDPHAATEAVDERGFAERVYTQTGVGLPESTIERTFRYGDFSGRNVRFAPSLNDSIYAWTFSPFPLAHLLTDCPTIRLYGTDLGTDKLGHIFQQGYEYFTRYLDARDRGEDDAAAIAGAVRYGVMTEMTFFGVMLTGVYSNGDLAGNIAGLAFYRNLFHEVRVGDRTLGPVLRRESAHWFIDPARDSVELLGPFISEHLNEAYNPSAYYFSVERIRDNIRARCARWFRQVADFDDTGYRARLARVKTWFGEPYGWDLPEDKAATLLACFPSAGEAPRADPARDD